MGEVVLAMSSSRRQVSTRLHLRRGGPRRRPPEVAFGASRRSSARSVRVGHPKRSGRSPEAFGSVTRSVWVGHPKRSGRSPEAFGSVARSVWVVRPKRSGRSPEAFGSSEATSSRRRRRQSSRRCGARLGRRDRLLDQRLTTSLKPLSPLAAALDFRQTPGRAPARRR